MLRIYRKYFLGLIGIIVCINIWNVFFYKLMIMEQLFRFLNDQSINYASPSEAISLFIRCIIESVLFTCLILRVKNCRSLVMLFLLLIFYNLLWFCHLVIFMDFSPTLFIDSSTIELPLYMPTVKILWNEFFMIFDCYLLCLVCIKWLSSKIWLTPKGERVFFTCIHVLLLVVYNGSLLLLLLFISFFIFNEVFKILQLLPLTLNYFKIL